MEGDLDGGGEDIEEVLDHAVKNSNLIVPPIPAEVGFLGSSEGARLLTSQPANAGITVEHMNGKINEENHLFEFSQIVHDDQLSEALSQTDLQEVHLAPMERMIGFQVKLSGSVG
jgi:hypothetical protein